MIDNIHTLVNAVVNTIINRILTPQAIRHRVASLMPSKSDFMWILHQGLYTTEETFYGRIYLIPNLPGIYEQRKDEIDDRPIIPFPPL
jgi:hypothetical protein